MNLTIVETAIQAKAILEFDYNGHHRVVEPHVLGISKGAAQILGYQVDGSSSSGVLPEWRRFDVSQMTRLVATDRVFAGRRPFPSGKHSSWDRQILIVAP